MMLVSLTNLQWACAQDVAYKVKKKIIEYSNRNLITNTEYSSTYNHT